MLLAELFRLDDQGWLRRNAVAAVKTMLQSLMGDTISAYVSPLSLVQSW
jgi:hypothetical protein